MSPLMQPGPEPPDKGRKYPAEVLTAEEVQALIGSCSARSASGIRNRALIALLYRSGLRVSEIVALRPADVDLRTHSVRVLHGKGDKATTRGFHPSCDDALARWIDTRKALGIRSGTLFCTLQGARCPISTSGTPCTASAARPEWTSACTRTACGTRSPSSWK